jgi:hypothetical protein
LYNIHRQKKEEEDPERGLTDKWFNGQDLKICYFIFGK